MEPRLAHIRCRVRLIAALADPYTAPWVEPLAQRLPTATVVEIEEGTVALPEQLPELFATLVIAFLDDVQSQRRPPTA
jgi:pimeloyl-ACP methyl ester carboxylesterase